MLNPQDKHWGEPSQSRRKDQFVSLRPCFTTLLVDLQREYTIKRNKTVALYQGGEEGRGWLGAKVFRVGTQSSRKSSHQHAEAELQLYAQYGRWYQSTKQLDPSGSKDYWRKITRVEGNVNATSRRTARWKAHAKCSQWCTRQPSKRRVTRGITLVWRRKPSNSVKMRTSIRWGTANTSMYVSVEARLGPVRSTHRIQHSVERAAEG